MLVLSPKKKSNYSMHISSSPRLRSFFWHQLLSVAGSSQPSEANRLRLCFLPQQGKSSALPSLFQARLSNQTAQWTAEAMWQVLLDLSHGMYLSYGRTKTCDTAWHTCPSPYPETTP